MVNKRKYKKGNIPYKRYIGGLGFVHDTQINNNLLVDEEREIIQKLRNILIDDSSLLQTNMVFPVEIFQLILKYCNRIEIQFFYVCKLWYHLCLPLLYHNPQLNSKNFSLFVESLSFNKKKKLGEYVFNLDLSTIIQSGKNSLLSKLLRRCSKNLGTFIAPQTSFGYSSLVSLKSCLNLKYLDLGLVSETVQLKELFQAISKFDTLTHLSFPRCSIECSGYQEFKWPVNLKYLKLSGNITNDFLQGISFSKTIDFLEFAFCPKINEHSIYMVLGKIGDNIKYLSIHYPMISLSSNSLDYIFRYCSNLITLKLTVDYCSKWIFCENMLTRLRYPRPLHTIVLESSGNLGNSFKIHPDDLTIAIAENRLPCLKVLKISSKLGWDIHSDDMEDLICCIENQNGDVYINY